MARITNLKALLLTLSVLAIAASSTLVSLAFADDQDGRFSHPHVTSSWDNSLVCGDHKCGPGEKPQQPPWVVPAKGIQ